MEVAEERGHVGERWQVVDALQRLDRGGRKSSQE